MPPSPAVLEKTFGRGRTLLFTSSADRDWNELAVFPTYVPLIRESAYHLVRRSERFENLLVGDSYRRDLERFVQDVVLERGGKQLELLKPVPRAAGAGFEVRVDGANPAEERRRLPAQVRRPAGEHGKAAAADVHRRQRRSSRVRPHADQARRPLGAVHGGAAPRGRVGRTRG